MWVATSPPPATLALPCTIRSSPSISTVTPLARSMAAVASSRSDSLTRNSFKPRMRVTPSANAAATARIGYSSIIDGARSAGTSTPFSAERAHAQIGDLLAAVVARRHRLDPGAHLAQRRQQSGAQRIGHHRFENQIGAGHDQSRHQRKRRRGRIGRHHDIGRLELGLALQRDAAAVLAMRLAGQLGAEMFQQPFGVVAGRLRFDHRGLARRGEARQQHRRLELRRRHRRFVDDRDRIGGALQRQRQPAAFGGFEHARAHLLQRIEHAPHRPLAQGGVAVEGRGHRRAGHRADRQPAAGAGIAEIERAGRLREAADADAVNPPQALGRRAPAGRRARAWPRRYAARPRPPAGRQPCSRRPSARPESGHGARSICRPAPGYGPARGRRGGRSAVSKRQGSRALSLTMSAVLPRARAARHPAACGRFKARLRY